MLRLTVLRLRMSVAIACTLLVTCLIHNTANAFPAGFLDGLSNLARGEGDLTDICGVLFVPCVIIFILTKRTWLRWVTAGIWFLDLAVDPGYWFHHMIATAMLAVLVYFIRWIVIRHKKGQSDST